MGSLLEAAAELDAGEGDAAALATITPGDGGDGAASFYKSKEKTGTWKKLKRMMAAGGPPAQQQQKQLLPAESGEEAQPSASNASCGDDAASEAATTELGRGSRLSMRQESTRDEADSGKGTLRNLLGKNKKKRVQIELDALRFEMCMLQERHDLTERDLATHRHDLGTLRAERDHLASQVHELDNALSLARSELAAAEAELDRVRSVHLQVKAALQESYGRQQEHQKQLKELEELCGAQQNSLEEGEEKYRALQQEHDRLHHTALAAKAQLVTAQAQLSEARKQRDELLADLAALTSQATALQSEIDSRDERMGGLQAAADQANSGLESALSSLQELEGQKQQLEARVTLLQEENLELSTALSGATERHRQLEVQHGELEAGRQSLQQQLDAAQAQVQGLTERLADMGGQLAASSEVRGSLHAQNGELLQELARLREEQQAAAARQEAGLISKWRKGSGTGSAAPAVKGSSSGGSPGQHSGGTSRPPVEAAAAAPVGPGAAAPAAAGGASGDPSAFSPMTSQLPAARAPPPLLAQPRPSVTEHDVAPAQAGSGRAFMSGGDAAGLGDAAAGPLTASRPGSRRPGANNEAGSKAPAQPAVEADGKTAATWAPKRAAVCGASALQVQGSRRQPREVVARWFRCLAPPRVLQADQ